MQFSYRFTLLCCAVSLLFTHSSLSAKGVAKHPEAEAQPKKKEPFPWLTGPLLTPPGHVIPNGHYDIEPYEFVTVNTGVYDKRWHAHSSEHNFYAINTQVVCQFGLPADFDVIFTPAWTYNHIEGASRWDLNDLNWGIDYQILNDKKDKWWPAIKLALRANLPIGRYQKLNPKKKGTDIGGTGSWFPAVAIAMSHLYWWGGHIFFAPRFNVQYAIPNSVHVKNFNAYGGGHHTNGRIIPGQNWQFLFGFELSFTQRWAFAADIEYFHVSKTRFKGRKGATDGVPNVVGLPSSEQFSLAPAIEYNWSANYGVIAGIWYTFAGRNQIEFISGVIAVNIYH